MKVPNRADEAVKSRCLTWVGAGGSIGDSLLDSCFAGLHRLFNAKGGYSRNSALR
ncbi:MAG: hypothetical protein ACI906_003654 [Candidatus Latescibacterota bacterium]|jgi:hypothetical protein